MFRTTRTVTSRVISCIVVAGLLVAYYVPYYPSMKDRWLITDDASYASPLSSPLFSGVSYRLIRPTSHLIICDDKLCDDNTSLHAVFSGGIINNSLGKKSDIILSLTGYGDIVFSGLLVGEKGWHMSLISSSWSGKVFIPGATVVGDGVLSFLSSGYMDMRRLGASSSFFHNPYQKVLIDRRFISQ